MIGIIVMSYGSPQSIDDVESYFTHILNGRTPPAEHLNRIVEQFRSLETADLLGSYTVQQAEALQKLLRLTWDQEVKVYAGCKHAPPFMEDMLQRMIEDNVTQVVTLPLTPLYSKTGVGVYRQAVRDYLNERNISIPVVDIEHWHLDAEFVDALAKRVNTAIQWLSEEGRAKSTVVFTTHSKPGTFEKNEVYCRQFAALAEQIAKKLEVADWRLAYRSARPGQEWLGPDVKEVIFEEAARGQKGIVGCDLLTIASNLEALHEVGRDCKQFAKEQKVEYVRAEFLNDSADFMFALASIVKRQLQELEDER